MPKSIAHFSASRIIIGSIILAIAIGTMLLSLPICQARPVPLFDTFFTAVSSICVCGLSTVPISHFTYIGHAVILVLMQVGGLSLVTLTLFLLSLFIKMGLRSKLMAGQLLELESWKKFKTILFFTMGITFCTELIGMFLVYASVHAYYGNWMYGMFVSLFHSVSAFCHVGFTLFPETTSFWADNYFLLLSSSLIMLIGSLGFLTWHDLAIYFKNVRKRKHANLTLYSKLTIVTTIIIIVAGLLIYWSVERGNTLYPMTSNGQWINAFFNILAARGVGFHSTNVADLTLATLLIIMIISFIGTSPGSTGSGIKTTTVALIYAAVKTAIKEQKQVTIFNRSIARDQVFRALAVFFISFAWILFVTFLLLLTEPEYTFIDLLFECISSFATLGLTTGVTPLLSPTGKFLIIANMIIGRIGTLGFVFAIMKRSTDSVELSYPEERIMMG